MNKKQIVTIALLAGVCSTTYAQNIVRTKLVDKTNTPIAGASIMAINANDSAHITISDQNGNVYLNITNLNQRIKITALGYATQYYTAGALGKLVPLMNNDYALDELSVIATRVQSNSATTHTNIGKDEITKNNTGQDLPYILNNIAGTVVTSNAGAGVGYTSLRIRGSDVTRINFTVNGVALNDPESHGTFFVNMPDFLSSVNNIQVQRGLGTSTNGAGAFGATVNIATDKLSNVAYAELNNSYGSYNTIKNTVKVGTGLINNHYAFDARLSSITSSGYIDRATSNLKSYYLQGGYYGAKTVVKFITFTGKEKTYQAWNGVPQDSIKTNRTYNEFNYDNQTDNYQQSHYQLVTTHYINAKNNINVTLHRTDGKGYYEEYKTNAKLSDYNLQPQIIGNDTIISSNIIRRKWLDNTYNGVVASYNYNNGKNLAVTVGGGLNEYLGKHYGEIIYSQYSKDIAIRTPYYYNKGLKNDFNAYAKINYNIVPAVALWADVQYRILHYNFLGYNTQLQNVQQSVVLPFVNPKFGATYTINKNHFVYASYSIGHKEPNRDDYTQSSMASRPKAEQLNDLEVGYRFNTRKISAELVGYRMDYKNQLIANGSINDVGAYNRVNVPVSYRQGVELTTNYAISKQFLVGANAAFSQNKIKSFKEYVYNYDSYTDDSTTYSNTTISFSPGVIVGAQLVFKPVTNFDITWSHKYVGKQYLDNTQSNNRVINAYYTSNLQLSYTLIKVLKTQSINFNVSINNMFNALYANDGYTYSDVSNGARNNYNYYYPQAPLNFMLGLNVRL
ncbi:MAG: TonB-dependent receptor [Bacteroidia bacterium]|nr:TonB-dependent receptor [Bacteroidia bacterium]